MPDTHIARTYLRRLRADSGMTMQDVADAIGITRQYYEMIESGERQRSMDLALVVKIADVFGVPLTKIAEYEKLRLEENGDGNDTGTDRQNHAPDADAGGA